MKKRILTTLLVLAVVVGAVFAVNAADTSPSITGVSLITENMKTNGASLYYTMEYPCAQGDLDSIASYGVAMCLGGEPDYNGDLVNEKPTVMTEITDKSGWSNGVLTAKSSELRGILKASVSYDNNKNRAKMPVYCQAYVKMTDGTIKTGNVVSFCLADVFAGNNDTYGNQATGVDTLWDSTWNYEKKAAVVEMQKLFKVLDTFGSDRLNQLFVSGETFDIKDASDLQIATNYPTHNFKLMEHIEMKGETWTPFINYTGTFDGNGYEIRNLTITPAATATSAGFFGTVSGTVKNLHLRDVTVNATNTKATAVGTIAGTNNGTITGVTATGYIKDTRKGTEAAPIYVGALVGKTTKAITVGVADLVNENELDGEQRKTLQVKNGATVYEAPSANYYKVQNNSGNVVNLAADVGFGNAQNDYVVTGLVGDGAVNGDATAIFWRDHSNSSSAFPTTQYEYSRRLHVSQYMNAMGSTAWRTTVPLMYVKDSSKGFNEDGGHLHNNKYYVGTTYYGTPYAHTSSTLEQIQASLDNGVLKEDIAKISYNSTTGYGVFYNAATTANGTTFARRTGVGQWFGNDCSSAVSTAWYSVSPSYLGAGGVKVMLTNNMVPSTANVSKFGFETVGDYYVNDTEMQHRTTLWKYYTGNYVEKKTASDYLYTLYGNENDPRTFTATLSGAETEFPVVSTLAIVDAAANTDEVIYESYAQASMGDAMIYGEPTFINGNYTYSYDVSGHTMLIVGDPVTIRNANDDIDAGKSFMIVSEQGAGLYNKNLDSSWLVNTKYTYEMLLTGTDSSYDGTKLNDDQRGYLPITMPYFDYAKEANANCYDQAYRNDLNGTADDWDASTTPDVGRFNSNYRIESAKMKVWKYDGTSPITKEAIPADSNCLYVKTAYKSAVPNGANDAIRGYAVPITFSQFFADYDETVTAAQAIASGGTGFGKGGFVKGQTYAYTVIFTLSNGKTVSGFVDNSGKAVYDIAYKTFTYAG